MLYIAKDSKEYSVTITKNLFGKEKGFTAADAKLLGELANAVEVSFQHPDTDDAWVAPLKGLKNLKKLHLEKSKITDKALDTVGAIGSLEYLNLYKTGVTDAGLDKLSGLKNLKTLYLWQTKVTEPKVKAFQDTCRPRLATKIFPSTSAWKKISLVNILARLAKQRASSEESAREAAMKAAKAEADRIAAIKNPTFEKDILPIFQKTCVECQARNKQKAELRLDTFAELQKGADGIPVFVAGKIGESELHARVILPDSDGRAHAAER